jgi:hypothetical protein
MGVDLPGFFHQKIRGIPLGRHHNHHLISLPEFFYSPAGSSMNSGSIRQGCSSVFVYDQHTDPSFGTVYASI